jgi:hypothetical protein
MTSNNAGERTSRALDATADLTELLRLAHSAIERAQREAHGEAYQRLPLRVRALSLTPGR